MRMRVQVLLMAAMAAAAVVVRADDDGDALWGWHVSVGGNIGFGLKTNLRASPANAMRRMPALTPPVGPSRAAAEAVAKPVPGGSRVVYDAERNYFIDPSSSWGDTPGYEAETWNWRLPDSAVVGSGADRRFVLSDGSWSEVVAQSQSQQSLFCNEESAAYGASVDLSHELWVSEDATWGVDIAIGLTWVKAFDCFRTGGTAVRRTAEIERGDTVTTVPGEFFALGYAEAEDDDTWGNGTYAGDDPDRDQFILNLNDISTTSRVLSRTSYADSLYMNASGDYEEWEISILLKPWYNVNDWLCLHGSLGVGITRSSFDYSLDALCNGVPVYRSSQEFNEWRCYGIAGAGALVRLWDFDLSCDGLFRWCQKDMEINGPDVNGTIEKPRAMMRFGLSYAF